MKSARNSEMILDSSKRGSAVAVKRGDVVSVRGQNSLLAHKAAVKKVSSSAKVEPGSKRHFGFIPPEAPIKISRWPKL